MRACRSARRLRAGSRSPGLARAFAFSGEILRIDVNTGNTVVRFDEIEPDTAKFLDQAVKGRLH